MGRLGFRDPSFINVDAKFDEKVPSLVKEVRKDPFLTPSEVGKIFGVDPKTVTRWAVAGKLGEEWVDFIRTIGGSRRYRTSLVKRLLEQNETVASPEAQRQFARFRREAKSAIPVQRVPGE